MIGWLKFLASSSAHNHWRPRPITAEVEETKVPRPRNCTRQGQPSYSKDSQIGMQDPVSVTMLRASQWSIGEDHTILESAYPSSEDSPLAMTWGPCEISS